MTDQDFFNLLIKLTEDHITSTLYPCLEKTDTKHNFSNILSRKETALKILHDGKNTFLHANTIGYYPDQCSWLSDTKIASLPFSKQSIAMQAPWLCRDLYLAYFLESESNIIVDLTNDNEVLDNVYGATECYPSSKGAQIEQPDKTNIAVSCSSSEKTDAVCIYDYQLKYENRVKEMRRIQFPNWPDHGAITSKALFELIETLETNLSNPNDPIIVHCKAGVGRTGSFIVARELYHLYKNGSLFLENLDETIFGLILQGRRERGPAFVESFKQVRCLREFGRHLLTLNVK